MLRKNKLCTKFGFNELDGFVFWWHYGHGAFPTETKNVGQCCCNSTKDWTNPINLKWVIYSFMNYKLGKTITDNEHNDIIDSAMHTQWFAQALATKAGPKDLAGFILDPVKGICKS